MFYVVFDFVLVCINSSHPIGHRHIWATTVLQGPKDLSEPDLTPNIWRLWEHQHGDKLFYSKKFNCDPLLGTWVSAALLNIWHLFLVMLANWVCSVNCPSNCVLSNFSYGTAWLIKVLKILCIINISPWVSKIAQQVKTHANHVFGQSWPIMAKDNWFCSQGLNKVRRRKPTPWSCSLTSTHEPWNT